MIGKRMAISAEILLALILGPLIKHDEELYKYEFCTLKGITRYTSDRLGEININITDRWRMFGT